MERSTNKDKNPTTPTVPTQGVAKYIEPAIIVTLVTCSAYYLGWSYIDGYFERLSIHHKSFEFPPYFYLRQSFWPIFAGAPVLIWSFWDAKNSGKTAPRAFRGNTPMFFIAGFIAYLTTENLPALEYYFLLGSSIFVVICFIFMSLRRTSIALFVVEREPAIRIALLVGSIFFLICFSRFLGGLHAMQYGQGTLHNVIAIELKTKQSFPEKLNDKNLLLIIYRQGKYYVIEKQNPLPTFPKVYIVPDDQVKFATQRRIK